MLTHKKLVFSNPTLAFLLMKVGYRLDYLVLECYDYLIDTKI